MRYPPRSSNGWIKLHGSLFEHAVAIDGYSTMIFVWLITFANWKDSQWRVNGKRVIIKRGQIVTSAMEVASRLKLETKTVARKLKWLEECGSIVQQTSFQGRIITICNYEKYQGEMPTDVQPMSSHVPSHVPSHGPSHVPTNEEEKKRRKKDIVPASPADEAIARSWFEYAKTRSKALKWSEKWPEAAMKIRERLGIGTDRLQEALEFVRIDEFWGPNAVALPALLKLSKSNSRPKIENLLTALDRSKNEQRPVDKKNGGHPVAEKLNLITPEERAMWEFRK